MALDPIDSRSVFGPNWNAYEEFYNQESPAKQIKKSVGVPPHSLYDTMQPITGPQPGHVDLSTTKSVGSVGNGQIAPSPGAPGVSGPGNDRIILKDIFSATSQRKDSHEAIEQDALDAIFKNKEMIKILQRDIAKTQDKVKNASYLSRVMGWVSWAVSGALAVSIFAALGFAFMNPAAVVAVGVGEAIGGIATIVLGVLQGISSLTKAFFDYKRGKHEQEIEQKKFELTKRQKALKSKMGQVNTEEQQKSSEFSRQTDLQKSYFQAGRIFGG